MFTSFEFSDNSYYIKSNYLIDVENIDKMNENLKFDLINVCIENKNIENSILNLKKLCKNLDISGRFFQITYSCLLNNNKDAFNFIFEESDFALNKKNFLFDEREKIQDAFDVYKDLEDINDAAIFIEEFLNKKQKEFLLSKLENYKEKNKSNISKKRKM